MTFFSAMIIPIIISIVLFIGLKEKKYVYDIFVDGAKEGIKITLKLFPKKRFLRRLKKTNRFLL